MHIAPATDSKVCLHKKENVLSKRYGRRASAVSPQGEKPAARNARRGRQKIPWASPGVPAEVHIVALTGQAGAFSHLNCTARGRIKGMFLAKSEH